MQNERNPVFMAIILDVDLKTQLSYFSVKNWNS